MTGSAHPTTVAVRPGSLVAERPTPPRDRPVTMARLTSVELRKATDTRAGRWLLVMAALVGAAAAVLGAFAGHVEDHDLAAVTQGSAFFMAVLVPVLGVLLVTSEWSQRTALTTFTLVPRRGRVVAAKGAAAVVMGLGITVLAVALGSAATAFATHPAGTDVWNLDVGALARIALYEVIFVLLGVGFGLVFLNSALAIVVYFVLPTAWTVLVNTVSSLHAVRDWLDASTTFGNLLDSSTSGRHWAQVGVTALVWVVVPVVVGTLRVRRSSVG